MSRPWMTVAACRRRLKGVEETLSELIEEIAALNSFILIMEEEE